MSLALSSQGFVELNWHSPLKLEDYLAAAPADGVAKGMFFTCIKKLARERSGKDLGREHYTRFKNYPLKEWLSLLHECAQVAHPKLPLRKALFETGAHTYRTFADSTLGSIVMSVAGRDFRSALRLVTKAYRSMDAAGQVMLLVDEPRRAVIRMRNMFEFPDCYQAGVLAAGARNYGVVPVVRVQLEDPFNCDVELTW